MNFITKLPKTLHGVDSILVITDRLTKSADFLPIQENSLAEKITTINIKEVVSRHGVPVLIIYDRDIHFTSRFWRNFHYDIGS